MYVDSAQPGDILLFKRSPSKCAASPVAALSCLAQSYQEYNHIGLVVPHPTDKYKMGIYECTVGAGIRVMDLSDRIKLSRSDEILLVPLNVPGERRGEEEEGGGGKKKFKLVEKYREELRREIWGVVKANVAMSKANNYDMMHGSLSFFGGISRRLPLSETTKAMVYKGPVNPSCMFVLDALSKAGVLDRRQGGKVMEEVLRGSDCGQFGTVSMGREREGDIMLRPGFRYGRGVVVKS